MSLGMIGLGSAWPVALSLAAAVTARGVLAGRRRTALNEALHELRRPLQALRLSPAVGPAGAGLDSTVRLAVDALDRLDREINGSAGSGGERAALAARPLLEAALSRWAEPAAAAGCSLGLRWIGGEATLAAADRESLERALDNLLANAIEHGGPAILLIGRQDGGELQVSVRDWGRPRSACSRRLRLAALLARISGRRRRGHGLRVVRRVAGEHGGEFRLRRLGDGAEATLALPLAASRA